MCSSCELRGYYPLGVHVFGLTLYIVAAVGLITLRLGRGFFFRHSRGREPLPL
ncbi:MAG: hypothetical protein IKK15_05895 [Akkermansia sp.]|nr:hypothetical protein [Akkermansia sp.]